MKWQYWIMLALITGCMAVEENIDFRSWETTIRDVGTFSSPRACDLTGDGVKDIVFGVGKVEMQPTDTAIIALNGANGELLWRVGARDQMFGSAIFRDITEDGVPDVFIGGRSAEFVAIDGSNGEIIWEYFPHGDEVDATLHKLYNFYNPQFIQDIDKDGYEDILVANGGYVKALPNDPNRPPGKLMIISAKHGDLIAEAYMPDGKETYMSSIVMDEQHEDPRILFGTGGERISGNLNITNLTSLLEYDISDAKRIATGNEKGFIAPPILADITGDGQKDIIANAVEGWMVAIDGETYEELWKVFLPGTEAYCSLAVGHFNEDGIPDFFTNFGIGVFPDLMQSIQLAVSGKDGSIIQSDTIGSFHYGSPVAYDIDGDRLDEVFYHVNESHPQIVKNVLKIYDINNDTIYNFSKEWSGANIASTPLIDDLNNDGFLEIICLHENNPLDFFSLEYKNGVTVHTFKTKFSINKPVQWGAYMGSHYDGKYDN